MSGVDMVWKRVADLVVASVGFVFALPVLVLLGLIVKMDSKGPALFRQRRVGMSGEIFRITKLRTMQASSSGDAVSSRGDTRITSVGKWLRLSKLDELPQLLDVVLGHMSLVGPRPEVPEFVNLWSDQERATILSVRPGLTDPASIALRHEDVELAASGDPAAYYVEVLLPRKAKLYVEYVEERTGWGDFLILLRTAAAVLRG